MTHLTTTTTFLTGGQSQGGYQAFHISQQSSPVWSVVLAVAVTTVALVGIVILRRRHRA
jgi:hypothetical protein